MNYDLLISLGLDLTKAIIGHFTKANFPQEVIDAVQAAYNAIEKHGKDSMTKDQWEALRG